MNMRARQHNGILTKKEPELLLIATSVRVLLESARRGGYTAAVIDGFCDREVMQHARYAERVSLCADGRLDDAELAKAIKNTTERYAETLSAVIVGSGIEGCSAASDAIAQSGLQWLGNARTRYSSAERLTCHFGSDKLAAMPDDRPPYLYKSTTGNGGLHIYSDDQSAPKSDDYYRQSYLPFASISHLFIADGRRIETVGFSTQWHAKHDAAHPFCFGGAISSHDLDESCITQAGGYAETLGLRGLNNIDYLYDGEKLYFLELNPRPSATMILYDSDYPTGLLHAHISACRGEGLAQPERIAPEIRGFAILYADQRMHLPADFDWPDEATDVPVAQPQGYRIEKNTPICTLHAQAADAADVLTILQAQICALQNRMSALQTIPDYQQAR